MNHKHILLAVAAGVAVGYFFRQQLAAMPVISKAYAMGAASA